MEYVYWERADEPTEDGTPINKALFDSIDTDLQARLLISNKATSNEAKAGANDVKYMTPAKVQEKISSLVKSGNITNTSGSSKTTTIMSSLPTEQIVIVDANITASSGTNNVTLRLTGTGIQSASGSETESGTTLDLKYYQTSHSAVRLVINTFTKTFYVQETRFNSTGGRLENTRSGIYSTLTALAFICPSASSVNVDYTIQYSNKNV